MFCRSLFVLFYFFFWPLCCLFFIDILTTDLVSPNSSYAAPHLKSSLQKVYGSHCEPVECYEILIDQNVTKYSLIKMLRNTRWSKCYEILIHQNGNGSFLIYVDVFVHLALTRLLPDLKILETWRVSYNKRALRVFALVSVLFCVCFICVRPVLNLLVISVCFFYILQICSIEYT